MSDLLAEDFFQEPSTPAAVQPLRVQAVAKPIISMESIQAEDVIYEDHQDIDGEKAPMANVASANVLFPEGYTAGELPKFSSQFLVTASRMDEAAQALFLADRANVTGLISQESITKADALVGGVISSQTPIGMFNTNPSANGVAEGVNSINAQVDKRMSDAKDTSVRLAEAFTQSALPIVKAANERLIKQIQSLHTRVGSLLTQHQITSLHNLPVKIQGKDWGDYLQEDLLSSENPAVLAGAFRAEMQSPLQAFNLVNLIQGEDQHLIATNENATLRLHIGDNGWIKEALEMPSMPATVSADSLMDALLSRACLSFCANIISAMRTTIEIADEVKERAQALDQQGVNISEVRELFGGCSNLQDGIALFQAGAEALETLFRLFGAVEATLASIEQ